jgi:ABC-2 type transport system ATP-binding protein
MLRVGAITKNYASVRALDAVSFTVDRGEIVGFLGPNGAGKTTAMRAVMGLITTDEGRITWEGEPIGPAVRHRVGYLPAERGMYPRMKVRDQLRYYTRLSGLTGTAATEATEGWIERLELTEYASEEVQALSSGNQQRVQLAMALAATPDLLLLDEPFSGLDPVAVAALSDTLRGEAERGAAVLLSSHQLDLVASLCSSVVVVNHGRVVLTGGVTALRAASRTRILQVTFADDTEWRPDAVEVRRDGTTGYEVRLDEEGDVRGLLDQAMDAGPVAAYSFRPPDLSEIFLSAIAAPEST